VCLCHSDAPLLCVSASASVSVSVCARACACASMCRCVCVSMHLLSHMYERYIHILSHMYVCIYVSCLMLPCIQYQDIFPICLLLTLCLCAQVNHRRRVFECMCIYPRVFAGASLFVHVCACACVLCTCASTHVTVFCVSLLCVFCVSFVSHALGVCVHSCPSFIS